jgi:hypothetical protein|tara:strand:+ start:473 stop:844 length:372 start_codon:yes stop_codon:yes gene_type:complete
MADAKGIGGQGPLVKVVWNDAAQNIKIHCIDGNNPENHLAQCETIGELVVHGKKALILVQHWSDTDGIDILAIPTDWCTSIEVLEKVGDALIEPTRNEICILENSESPQESDDVTTSTSSKKK